MTAEHEQEESEERSVKHIIQLLQQSRFRTYDDVAAWRNDLQASVRGVVARRLAPALNQKLGEVPEISVTDKQELCRWVNQEVRSSGLAIRCPKTGLPAALHVDPGYSPAGRFQIQLLGKNTGRKRTVSSTTLFPIELMDYPILSELETTSWAQKSVEKRQPGKNRDRG